jgi:hypothetical protein
MSTNLDRITRVAVYFQKDPSSEAYAFLSQIPDILSHRAISYQYPQATRSFLNRMEALSTTSELTSLLSTRSEDFGWLVDGSLVNIATGACCLAAL